MKTPNNTAVSIQFNARADMDDSGKLEPLFVQMAEYEASQGRSFNAQFSGTAAETRVNLNLTGAFTEAHESMLSRNGVLRWEQKLTMEGYRQRVRRAVIDFLKKPFS